MLLACQASVFVFRRLLWHLLLNAVLLLAANREKHAKKPLNFEVNELILGIFIELAAGGWLRALPRVDLVARQVVCKQQKAPAFTPGPLRVGGEYL
jgi:hypothetical protein